VSFVPKYVQLNNMLISHRNLTFIYCDIHPVLGKQLNNMLISHRN
jgi:hypothetical protein